MPISNGQKSSGSAIINRVVNPLDLTLGVLTIPDASTIQKGSVLLQDVTTDINSTNKATTPNYVSTLINQQLVGLWDDRGNYDASTNVYPNSGGSGTAGVILKGDIWLITVAGTLGGIAVVAGDTIRALIDTPAQANINWAILENNLGYVAENQINKENVILDTSATKYPTNNLVKSKIDELNYGYNTSSILTVSIPNVALTYGQCIIEVDTTTNNVNITLPLLANKPANIKSLIIEIRYLKKSGSNKVTILTSGLDTMINSNYPSNTGYTTDAVGEVIFIKYCYNNNSPVWLRTTKNISYAIASLPGIFIMAILNAAIPFNGNIHGTIPNNNGIFTLSTGVTYCLQAIGKFQGQTGSGSSAFNWMDSISNVILTNSIDTHTQTSGINYAHHLGISQVIYTPITNQTVKVGVTQIGNAGTQSLIPNGSMIKITQIS